MDRFEEDADQQEQERTLREILSVWASFRISLSELIDSYNNGPDGQNHPAKMTSPSDESLVIDCPQGAHPKQRLKLLAITVRAELIRGRLQIGCTIEKWARSVLPTNMPTRESTRKMRFELHEDGQSLLYAREQLTPYEAAEILLTTALLRKRS